MKNKSCLWGLIVIMGCLLFLCFGFPKEKSIEGNGVAAHGALQVRGTKLLGRNGETVVLRGMSSHGINWYPRYLNGNAMQTLAGHGANVQRIAMYTEAHRAYLEYPEENLNYLYMGVESALGADMYAIVDWHILKDRDPNTHSDAAEDFFQQVTAHYGNHPGILYEICNEPNGDTTWEDVVEYADRVIPVIRANAPDAVILVGVPNYCTDFSGPLRDPLPYDNLMYVLHRYIETSSAEQSPPYLLKKLVEAELPVFVSEWGITCEWEDSLPESEDRTALELHLENTEPFLDYMEAHQISWTAWALSNSNECHSILRRDCDKYSGWDEDDLTDFGRLVFQRFRERGG